MNEIKEPKNSFQKTEISNMKWIEINNCSDYIRDYSIEKKNIINKVKYIINNYKIFI